MRLFELTIEDFEDEVFAISLVNMPAIEALGTYFHKDEVHFAEMKEEGLFMAPILIPNKKILRVDGAGVPYEVFFTPETIKKLAQNYLEKKYQDQVTEEHKSEVDGVVMVESWIKESVESDKSKLYGLNVPAGSWIGTFKIANEELREKFRSGDLRAVSIEGMFTHLEKTPKDRLESALLMESFADFMEKDVHELSEVEATQFLSKIKTLLAEPSVSSTYPGAVASGSIAPATLIEEGELNVYGYETENFYICPGAIGTFNHLINEMQITEDDLVDMIRAAAVFADNVFDIEKDVLEDGIAKPEDLRKAEVLVEMFKDIFETIDERTGMKHDISYMDGHIEVIKKYL
jgi:mRNA-degrading endonuclease RelE of RelBE toxin-antitoxin system